MPVKSGIGFAPLEDLAGKIDCGFGSRECTYSDLAECSIPGLLLAKWSFP